MFTQKLLLPLFGIAIVGVALFAVSTDNTKVYAAADTCTWSGASNSNWSNGGNWTGCDNGNVPQSGDTLVFPSGAANFMSNNDLVGLTLVSLSFDGGYTVSGNSFSVSNGISNSSGVSTISNSITLTASQIFQTTGTGGLILNGNLNLNGSNFNINASDSSFNGLVVNGVISGAGSIDKIGVGPLTLNGNNTFSGNLVVSVGYLYIGNSNALGSNVGSTTISAGTAVNISTGGLSIPENFVIAGNGNVGGGALRNFTGNNTLAGTIALTGPTLIQNNTGNTLTINGVISGASASTLFLNGTIILNGDNTYIGITQFSSLADITFNGNQPNSNLNASNGAIEGVGSIGDIATLGGTLIYPASNSTIGTLSTHNLSFSGSGNQYHLGINNTVSDQLSVAGVVNLNNLALFINVIAPPTLSGQVYTIINNEGEDPVIGIFTAYSEGSTYVYGGVTYKISYVGGTGNDVTMTATINPNQPPVNTVPASQTTPFNTIKLFDIANTNLISISDPDAGSNVVKVSLVSTNGTISLSGVTGLSFVTGDGVGDAAMIFTGTIFSINNALKGLTFIPTNNFSGVGAIQITTNDQGNSGTGGPLSDVDVINVTVGANPSSSSSSSSVTTSSSLAVTTSSAVSSSASTSSSSKSGLVQTGTDLTTAGGMAMSVALAAILALVATRVGFKTKASVNGRK